MSRLRDPFHDMYITVSNHQNRYDCRMHPATGEGKGLKGLSLWNDKRAATSEVLFYSCLNSTRREQVGSMKHVHFTLSSDRLNDPSHHSL